MLPVFLRCVPIALSSLALSGWWLDIDALKRCFLPSVTMNPTTASCLMLLSLAAFRGEIRRAAPRSGVLRKAADNAAFVFLAVAIAVGVLKLVDVAASTHIRVDAFVFTGKLELQASGPSRMAPNAALCTVMIGCAIWCLNARASTALLVGQILALSTVLTALFAIIGYLFGVTSLYTIPAFIPMALHTATSFLCLAFDVLLMTKGVALMTPISDEGPGGRTARRLLPLAVVQPVVAGWFTLLGERAGLYTSSINVTIMVTVNLLIFTIVIWWNAGLVLKAEQKSRVANRALAVAATHDPLTRLANRGLFMDRLIARLAAFRRRETELFAVIFLDLDGFKQVNDRLGHETGDALLRQVADILRRCVRRDDLVARIGGDEFTMLLDRITAPDDPAVIAARVLEGMPRRVGPVDDPVRIGISIGGVISDGRHFSAESLLNEADQALYRSKRSGKHRFSLHQVLEHDPVP